MRKIVIYLILFTSIALLSCSNKPVNVIAVSDWEKMIAKLYYLSECNPTHAEDADEHNSLFLAVLKQRTEMNQNKRKAYLAKADALTCCRTKEDFDKQEYEDSPDIRRGHMKYSMYQTIIALLTPDQNLAARHFEEAKEVLQKKSELETEYIGLLLLELLMKYERKNLYTGDIDRVIRKVRNDNNMSDKTKTAILTFLTHT